MLQSAEPLDAGLAKRLAEAADCCRDGKYHYFVCKKTPPYSLHYTKGFDTDEEASSEADDAKAQLGGQYEKFGPYKTESDDEATFAYDAVQISFFENNVEIYNKMLEGDVDAIILSVSAYDKFLQPFYVRLYGIEVAAEMRQAAVTALTASPISPAVHLRTNNTLLSAKNLKSKPGGTLFIAGTYTY